MRVSDVIVIAAHPEMKADREIARSSRALYARKSKNADSAVLISTFCSLHPGIEKKEFKPKITNKTDELILKEDCFKSKNKKVTHKSESSEFIHFPDKKHKARTIGIYIVFHNSPHSKPIEAVLIVDFFLKILSGERQKEICKVALIACNSALPSGGEISIDEAGIGGRTLKKSVVLSKNRI